MKNRVINAICAVCSTQYSCVQRNIVPSNTPARRVLRVLYNRILLPKVDTVARILTSTGRNVLPLRARAYLHQKYKPKEKVFLGRSERGQDGGQGGVKKHTPDIDPDPETQCTAWKCCQLNTNNTRRAK